MSSGSPRVLRVLLFVLIVVHLFALPASANAVFLPLISGSSPSAPPPCEPIPGVRYQTLTILGVPTACAEQHPDLNLALRGYTPALGEYAGLLNNCGASPDDTHAPQLRGLFDDHRRPTFLAVYWVYQWDWAHNCRSTAVENRWGPSFATLSTTAGEVLRVPPSGYTIDAAQDLEVLVLYASQERITLKYTREDNVIYGYTLHLEGLCVEPSLLALYNAMNAAGRGQLPALHPGQPLGRAKGNTLGFAIRDSGTWMDPRNCADWWR